MRVVTAGLAAVAVIALATPGVAQATNWITVGPYPSKETCQPDKERTNQAFPAWGCYQAEGGWYYQYNRV
ncbi:hypothetical protein [Kibdelosporangium aridum]|uniref:Secreted protein n=1 Tax=Kibdelosporangium aridum TaxID=2030 RepID=A0A1W2FBC4_KIBAR|nr:hypothetical protein [Kibdelosporangium aridum]RSM91793.1 hypothetical protein DMH04_02145 [Kibdelosporangium aridum]SMD18846.1 hypothetical protein SAMN05661093_05927 [Kibdelosporangium aridum]